jgi:hypothetical protein
MPSSSSAVATSTSASSPASGGSVLPVGSAPQFLFADVSGALAELVSMASTQRAKKERKRKEWECGVCTCKRWDLNQREACCKNCINGGDSDYPSSDDSSDE